MKSPAYELNYLDVCSKYALSQQTSAITYWISVCMRLDKDFCRVFGADILLLKRKWRDNKLTARGFLQLLSEI